MYLFLANTRGSAATFLGGRQLKSGEELKYVRTEQSSMKAARKPIFILYAGEPLATTRLCHSFTHEQAMR